MNEAKLKALVAEGVVLERQEKEIKKRRKKIADILIAEAQGREDEHVETAGGGSSMRFVGADGCVAVVSFPARTLKSKIDGEGKTFDKIKDVAGPAMNRLFTPAVAWKPTEYFRENAVTVLGTRDGARLIKLCESESSPRVNFETANRETE